jgi:DNA-binding GntR family transcriptional regulator
MLSVTSLGDPASLRLCLMPQKPPPVYLRIADILRTAIRSGRYSPGDQLPSYAEIMGEYELGSVQTAAKAIGVLKAEGLAESRSGLGVFVVDELPEEKLSDIDQVRADIAALQEQVRQLGERLDGHEHY